ncbi:Chemotaxis protein CheW [Pirellula sp. SH-Sr6A]|uniref:chemotaxis protein CheW n=1 Tax=Pirellula sp. SH-Sr6A TaxID=1632865 RepID=UPI00078EEB0B|nr:chemotaxis protein CheW [Pirellula sp. SH-Sr6A]AMV30578.1 Chemotaxis protein CheW [Pirellula sp. SH-Sr6A]
MNNPILSSSKAVQYTTFFCNRAVLGLDISYVQEINRTVNLTRVPLSPPCVRGVMNLRGEVVTMLDLRILMGLPAGEPSKLSRNLILKYEGEVFGLWVDGVADILTIENAHIAPPPSNLSMTESRLIRGVYQSEKGLVMLIEPKELLNTSLNMARSAA